MDPLLGVGLDFATKGYKGVSAFALNTQQQDFIKEQYDRQRRDALADWHMQNEYNHPLEQMNRLRQAGLNPNLVYGKGADNTASVVRSSTMGSWNPQHVPLPNIGNMINQYQQLRLNKAQTDNVAANTAVAMAQRNNIESQTAKNIQETARSTFDLQQAQSLKDGVIERQKLDNQLLSQSLVLNVKNYDLQKMQQDINQARLNMDKAKSRQDIIESGQRIKESVQRTANLSLQNDYQKLKNNEMFPLERRKLEEDILYTQQSIANLRTAGEISKLDEQLRRAGINPQDPFYIRMFLNLNNHPKSQENQAYIRQKYIDKLPQQELYDKYNRLGGLSGTGMTWEEYKKRYMK